MKKYNFFQIILSVFLLAGSFNVYGQCALNGPHELSASSSDSKEHFNPCFVCNPDTSTTSYNGFMNSFEGDSLTVSDSIFTSDISKLCSTCHGATVAVFSHNTKFSPSDKVRSDIHLSHPNSVKFDMGNSDKTKICNPDIALSITEYTIAYDLQSNCRIELYSS